MSDMADVLMIFWYQNILIELNFDIVWDGGCSDDILISKYLNWIKFDIVWDGGCSDILISK